MFKLITNGNEIEGSKLMSEMKSNEIARIVSAEYKGTIVMRTQGIGSFEIMDLSNPGIGACWSSKNIVHRVVPLKKGSHIILEVI